MAALAAPRRRTPHPDAEPNQLCRRERVSLRRAERCTTTSGRQPLCVAASMMARAVIISGGLLLLFALAACNAPSAQRYSEIERPAQCARTIDVPHRSFGHYPLNWRQIASEKQALENSIRQVHAAEGYAAALNALTCSGFRCVRTNRQVVEVDCAWPDGQHFPERLLIAEQWCVEWARHGETITPFVLVNYEPNRRCLP